MTEDFPHVLVLTPVKDAAGHLESYFAGLERLAYPPEALSLGLLEGDSTDGTFEALAARLASLRARYRRVTLARKDFGFRIPDGVPRWSPPFQLPRRVVLAKARNRLLFCALDDEEWVLWLDVDVVDYPPDVLVRMLSTGKDIINPHCVTHYGGPTFDWNAWRDQGRVRMDALRGGPDLVRLDAVGAAMLLVRADLHREGLMFPPYLYGRQSRLARDPSPLTGRGVGEVESEGLGMMAKDMGHECWGMPNLEIVHPNE
jgi:GT2 family glycosyltransferase